MGIDAELLDVVFDCTAVEDDNDDVEDNDLCGGPKEVGTENSFKASGAGALKILPSG